MLEATLKSVSLFSTLAGLIFWYYFSSWMLIQGEKANEAMRSDVILQVTKMLAVFFLYSFICGTAGLIWTFFF